MVAVIDCAMREFAESSRFKLRISNNLLWFIGMATKRDDCKPPSKAKKTAPGKRGRPPSERARKYAWYRCVEDFQVPKARADPYW